MDKGGRSRPLLVPGAPLSSLRAHPAARRCLGGKGELALRQNRIDSPFQHGHNVAFGSCGLNSDSGFPRRRPSSPECCITFLCRRSNAGWRCRIVTEDGYSLSSLESRRIRSPPHGVARGWWRRRHTIAGSERQSGPVNQQNSFSGSRAPAVLASMTPTLRVAPYHGRRSSLRIIGVKDYRSRPARREIKIVCRMHKEGLVCSARASAIGPGHGSLHSRAGQTLGKPAERILVHPARYPTRLCPSGA